MVVLVRVCVCSVFFSISMDCAQTEGQVVNLDV